MPGKGQENPASDHRKKAERVRAGVAVITLSSTRTAANDQSGDIIQRILEQNGHTVTVREVIPDDADALRDNLQRLIRRQEIQAIITTGGTGLSPSDITVETVRPLLEKELPGFHSLFMLLSYAQVKSAAMLSRAVAGTVNGKFVACLPGSPRACELALESLIIPELPHILMLMGS